jgi:glycosyltransferase involved in cell wall biosynthesis
LVSVVIPARNAAATIERAIESILTDDVAMEVLVIDDHSEDETAEVVRGMGDPRVRAEAATGRGLVDALNQGLALASGPLIARTDADDWSLPGRITHQVEVLERTGAALCVGETSIVREDGSEVGVGRPFIGRTARLVHLGTGPGIAHGAVMFERSAVLEVGGYRHDRFPAEDFDLWVRLAVAGHELVSTPRRVYCYVLNPEGISLTRAAEQRSIIERIAADARRDLRLSTVPSWRLVAAGLEEGRLGGGPYRRNFAQTMLRYSELVAAEGWSAAVKYRVVSIVLAPVFMTKGYARGVMRRLR